MKRTILVQQMLSMRSKQKFQWRVLEKVGKKEWNEWDQMEEPKGEEGKKKQIGKVSRHKLWEH